MGANLLFNEFINELLNCKMAAGFGIIYNIAALQI